MSGVGHRNHAKRELARIDHLSVQGWRITDLGARLSPATPVQCRRLMAGVMRSGLRWVRRPACAPMLSDLDAARLRVIRTVIEVSGRTLFKPFPKTTAGRRTVPPPGWLVALLREHMADHPRGEAGLIFATR